MSDEHENDSLSEYFYSASITKKLYRLRYSLQQNYMIYIRINTACLFSLFKEGRFIQRTSL